MHDERIGGHFDVGRHLHLQFCLNKAAGQNPIVRIADVNFDQRVRVFGSISPLVRVTRPPPWFPGGPDPES